MDTMIRNNIFLENEDLIRNTIRRHWPLIRALRLERDDVYQELAMAALAAIDAFDESRSNSIQAHIWMQLQYAILGLKRKHRPGGLTQFCQWRPVIVSLECVEGLGELLEKEQPMEDALSPELKKALSKLEPSERDAVIRYLNGGAPRRKAQIRDLNTAFDKLRVYYVEHHCVLGGAL